MDPPNSAPATSMVISHPLQQVGLVSKEHFMEKFPVISNLKIRGSWGMTGNDKIGYLNQYS